MKKYCIFLFVFTVLSFLFLGCNSKNPQQNNGLESGIGLSNKGRLYDAKYYSKYAEVRKELIEIYSKYKSDVEEISPIFKRDLDLVVEHENLDVFIEKSTSVNEKLIEASLEGMESIIKVIKEKNKDS